MTTAEFVKKIALLIKNKPYYFNGEEQYSNQLKNKRHDGLYKIGCC